MIKLFKKIKKIIIFFYNKKPMESRICVNGISMSEDAFINFLYESVILDENGKCMHISIHPLKDEYIYADLDETGKCIFCISTDLHINRYKALKLGK